MIKLIQSTFHAEAKTKKELVKFILSAEQLSFGPECLKFEKNFAKYQGRKDAVFMTSGTGADFAVVQALLNLGRLKPGDEVGFSAVTWSTNVMPIMTGGMKPIPVDVELDTLNVSSRQFEAVLEKHPKLKMLLLTNLLGFCGDIDKIAAICKKRGIILVEDNCESLGTIYKGKKLGNYGLASTFSFFVGHHMSTIEGGMVCTNDKELSDMLRIVRAHGWDRHLVGKAQSDIRTKNHIDNFYAKYAFYDLAYNFRPTEINGFLGSNQLQYINLITKKRNHNFLKMAKAIYSNKKVYLPLRYSHIQFVSNFAVPLICRTKAMRDELVKKCEGKVEIRPIVGGDMTQQPFFKKYAKQFRLKPGSNAEFIHQHGLYFGNNQDMTDKDLNALIKIFS